MPMIYGSFLAGSLLSTLLPIGLLICFATYFYRQSRRMKTVADADPTSTESPANSGQTVSNQ